MKKILFLIRALHRLAFHAMFAFSYITEYFHSKHFMPFRIFLVHQVGASRPSPSPATGGKVRWLLQGAPFGTRRRAWIRYPSARCRAGLRGLHSASTCRLLFSAGSGGFRVVPGAPSCHRTTTGPRIRQTAARVSDRCRCPGPEGRSTV